MPNSNKQHNFKPIYWTTAALICWYIMIGWYLQQHHLWDSEALFLKEKAQIVAQNNHSIIQTLIITYPVLPFFGTLLFQWVGLLAPVIFSAINVALLCAIISYGMIVYRLPKYALVAMTIVFFLHPGLVWLGASGNGYVVLLVAFFFILTGLYEYYLREMAFHITFAGFFMLMSLFVDIRFFWVIAFSVPILVFLAQRRYRIDKQEEGELLKEVEKEFRRPLLMREQAVFSMILFLPLLVGATYLFFNHLFVGDWVFFLRSPYASWRVIEHFIYQRFHDNYPWGAMSYPFYEEGLWDIFMHILFVAPTFFLLGRWALKTPVLLGLAVLPCCYLLIIFYGYGEYPRVSYYMLLWVVGAVGIIYEYSAQSIRWWKILVVLQILSTGTSWYYFRYSNIEEERSFASIIWGGKPILPEDKIAAEQVADYLRKNLKPTERVLLDDALGFPIVAFHGDVRRFILPFQSKFFLLSLSTPSVSAAYIVAQKKYAPLHAWDKVAIKKDALVWWGEDYKTVFTAGDWEVLKRD